MVTRNRDRVEFGHVLRRVFENVGDDLHREFGRVDVGVAHHELLEDVVLDRAAELVERAALLEAGHDVEGQYLSLIHIYHRSYHGDNHSGKRQFHKAIGKLRELCHSKIAAYKKLACRPYDKPIDTCIADGDRIRKNIFNADAALQYCNILEWPRCV